ncbi:MAG: zinc ribbon domain-containing protein [Pseudomonadota bacterium]
MYQEKEEVQLTKIESVFVFGIIGCMLFATWELGHLMADEWFHNWVEVDSFVRRRLILYGIAFIMSIASVLFTIKYADNSRRFVQTINRAFLWYGTLLLISTIAIFVFDCLPEVFAGFIGAGVFIGAIYIIQKKYFTRERNIAKSIEKGRCFSCGGSLLPNAMYCSQCNEKVGQKCESCGAYARINDKFCSQCGKTLNRR